MSNETSQPTPAPRPDLPDAATLETLRLVEEARAAWKTCHDWKHKPEEIGIDRKLWRSLVRRGLVRSRGFGCELTFAGKYALRLSQGVDLFEGM